MNVSARAATQLRILEPTHVAAVLDDLRGRSYGAGSHLVEVDVSGAAYRCFVARHRDGSLVLLGVVSGRSRDGPVSLVMSRGAIAYRGK